MFRTVKSKADLRKEVSISQAEKLITHSEVISSQLATTNENFTISRYQLRKSDVVYSDEHMLCVRLQEKTV